MKTALTEFLELLEKETNEYYEIINNNSDYHDDDVEAAKTAVTDLEKLLEKGKEFLEKEKYQIEAAFNEGQVNYNEDSQDTIDSEEYFMENFGYNF